MRICVILLLMVLLFGCTSRLATVDKNTTKNASAATSIKISESEANLEEVTNITEVNTTQHEKELDSLDQELADDRPKIYFFYSSLCFASNAIMPKINELDARYNQSVEIVRYNVVQQKDLDRYNEFATKYNLSQKDRVVPMIYADGIRLSNMFQLNRSLEEVIINMTRGEQ